MDGNLFLIGFRTLFIYGLVLVVMRLMGKREIGKLSIFDFVVYLMIAEIAVFSIEDLKKPMLEGLLPVFLLVMIQIGISYLSLKSRRIRELMDGKAVKLIENGKIKDREMAKERYNLDDLLSQLRERNIASIADVELAVLETTGKLNVIKKPEKEAVTREDLGMKNSYLAYPVPVVIDGEVMDENLEKLGKNRLWLKQRLKKAGTTDFRKVFFASVDDMDNLFVDLRDPD